MNHTIKGIIIAAAITSMLVMGATMIPIMQNSFAYKKSDFKRERDTNANTNTNANKNTNTNTITNTITNTNTNTNTNTPSPPPVDPCPHSPYTDFSGGLCQNGESTLTCRSLTTQQTSVSSDASGKCIGTFSSSSADNMNACTAAGGTFSNPGGVPTCTGYSPTQTPPCPTPEGSTQTPTVVNGRCTIQPETT